MTTQYDGLVDGVARAEALSFRTYIEMYSVMVTLGDIRGKDVLDVACGDGLYSRRLRSWGAAKIVGVDISKELINAAREMEQKEPRGIEYHTYDVAKMPVLGAFDVVLAAYLLHYAESFEHMTQMCRAIYANLKPGGRLVTVAANPEFNIRGPNCTKYGITIRFNEPVKDGDRVFADVHVEPPFTLEVYHWCRATHERALAEAGFKNLTWVRPECSPEGLAKYGDFWKDYLENPHAVLIACEK
jgi:SAM-dependent methyltransferase